MKRKLVLKLELQIHLIHQVPLHLYEKTQLFKMFSINDLINLVVNETNNYAEQKIQNKGLF